MGRKGMVLSGTALLLVLPALLLSATFLNIVETGGKVTAIQTLSDKAAYKAEDIKQNLRDLKASGERIDSTILQKIAENYEKNTIFDNIQINFQPFNIWVRYSHESYGEYNHYATENFCEISNLGQDRWYYNFEAQPNDINWDFNEPLLKLKRLGSGKWEVKVSPTFTHASATGTVYWENKVIFWNVNGIDDYYGDPENIAARDPGGTGGGDPGDGWQENESTIVTGVPSAALVKITLEDPGGTVHYEETFPLTTGGVGTGGAEEVGLTYNEDAIAKDGLDDPSENGGVEFSVTNNYDKTVTINSIKINPDYAAGDEGISDDVGNGNDDPGETEVYIEGDVDDYVDYGGGTTIPSDGLTVNISPETNTRNTFKFYLYEFYYNDPFYGWTNYDMTNEDIEITINYEVGGNSKTKTFTITPQ